MATSTQSGKSRKTARSPAASPATPPPAGAVRLFARLFRPAVLLTLVCLAAAAMVVPRLPDWLPNLVEQPEYQLEFRRIDMPPAADWVPATLLEEVRRIGQFPESVSLLQPGLCRDVATALMQHPWIRRVNSVEITSPPGLRADVDYRLPAAFVACDRGLYPVDREGVLLPPADFSPSMANRLPLIQGIRSLPQGPAGLLWGDSAVEQAADLAALLAPDRNLDLWWKPLQLKAIVVPAGRNISSDDLSLEIESAGGSRIQWGRVSATGTLEPTAEQKLLRMQQYVRRFGSFEKPEGPYRIDLRHLDATQLEPLSGIRR